MSDVVSYSEFIFNLKVLMGEYVSGIRNRSRSIMIYCKCTITLGKGNRMINSYGPGMSADPNNNIMLQLSRFYQQMDISCPNGTLLLSPGRKRILDIDC